MLQIYKKFIDYIIARTLLLGGNISLNLLDSSNAFYEQTYHCLLPIPEQTWNDSHRAKMHDFYPIVLYCLGNCIILLGGLKRTKTWL